MELDQTTIYIIIAAVIVGIFLGGSVVMTLVRIISGFFRQQQGYYDPNGYQHIDDRRDRGSGCFTVIIAAIIGVIIITQFVDSKFVNTILRNITGNSKTIETPMITKNDQHERLTDKAKSEILNPEQYPETEQQKPAPTPEVSTDDTETFVVQIGAYANKEGARTVFQECDQKGYPVGVFTKEGAPGQTLYVVIVGEGLTESAAQDLKAEIKIPGSKVIPADDLDLHYSETYLRR